MLFFFSDKKQVNDDCSNFESSLKEGEGRRTKTRNVVVVVWCSSSSGDDDDLTERMRVRKQGLGRVYRGERQKECRCVGLRDERHIKRG